MAGDWNLSPEQLFNTGWPAKIKGAVVKQDEDTLEGTCITSAATKASYIDFYVCSANMESMLQGTGVDREAPFGTHRVVAARLAAKPHLVLVPKLRAVKEIPPDRPSKGLSWKDALCKAQTEKVHTQEPVQ